jgi:hypothetical protein
MAMVPADLKALILSKMDPPPETAAAANQKWGDALAEYLEANCDITCAWVAANPGGTPDPAESFEASPEFAAFALGVAADYSSWLLLVGAEIHKGAVVPTDSSFVLSPPLLITALPVISVPSGLTDPDAAILAMCTDIITSIKTMVGNTAAGVHGVYTGTATISTIL